MFSDILEVLFCVFAVYGIYAIFREILLLFPKNNRICIAARLDAGMDEMEMQDTVVRAEHFAQKIRGMAGAPVLLHCDRKSAETLKKYGYALYVDVKTMEEEWRET